MVLIRLVLASVQLQNLQLTDAISLLVQQKFMKLRLTKSAPQQMVTVFSSRVSCEPIVTICLSFGS